MIKIISMLLFALLFLSRPVCAQETYQHLDQLQGKTIGMQTGNAFDEDLYRCIPSVTIEFYNAKADMVAALEGGKISGFVMDEPAVLMLMHEYDRLSYIPEYLNSYDFGYIYPKNQSGEKALQPDE